MFSDDDLPRRCKRRFGTRMQLENNTSFASPMKRMSTSSSMGAVATLLILMVTLVTGDSSSAKDPSNTKFDDPGNASLEEWQHCQIFLAPTLNKMGWGVFAGRSFRKGEIVELAPGFVAMPMEAAELHNTILDDYVYGYWRVTFRNNSRQPDIQQLHVASLGMVMFYNHQQHPSKQNVEFTTFSREPAPDVPNTAQAIGLMATRSIRAGEQLFSHYGDDGGADDSSWWFSERQIELGDPNDENNNDIPSTQLFNYKSDYCSKLHGGIGLPTWRDRILPILPPSLPFWLDTTRLPPFDAGDAKAKVDIAAGDRIELSTGMVVSYALVQDSSLGAWAISWQDLDETNREALRLLKDAGRLVLQYQGDDTSWKRVDRFRSFDDVAILPLSGNAGTIRRVGNEEDGDDGTNHNCRLVIQPTMIEDTLGVTLEWIATQDIAIGEMITVNLPSGGSKRARRLLEKEQKLTGQINYFSVDERAAPNKASKDEL